MICVSSKKTYIEKRLERPPESLARQQRVRHQRTTTKKEKHGPIKRTK
jgi:hypothetical protein